MGGCQNRGPFLGTLNIRCRIIIGTQEGTIILTTTHIGTLDPMGKDILLRGTIAFAFLSTGISAFFPKLGSDPKSLMTGFRV